MFSPDSEFFQRSKTIAGKFLQTTVIIDDEAYFGNGPLPTLNNQNVVNNHDNIESLVNLTQNNDVNINSVRASRGSSQLNMPYSDPEGMPYSEYAHLLNAQEVINSFAQKRIVCSVIRPTDELDLTSIVANLASSTDVIIIDWSLNEHEQKGKKALDILEHISRSAATTPEQLRLFAIYTGEPGISDIAQTIKADLAKRLGTEIQEEDEFTLRYKAVRIVVFSKPYTSIPEQYHNRQVSFTELAERIIAEFAMMTAGLISNVAVESLTCIRENTFRILERFTQDLDTPYLTHRLLQADPEDVEDHLIILFSEEIRAILEEAKVGKQAGAKPISEWFASKDIQTISPFQGKTLSRENLELLTVKGSAALPEIGLGKNSITKLFKSLTAAFLKSDTTSELDEKFAVLTNMRSFYDHSDRVLTLGTIIKTQSSSESGEKSPSYYLCLQPVCDTIRLDSGKGRAFPFIPLSLNNDKFSIVAYDESEKPALFIRLDPKTKPYDLRLIVFSPQDQNDRIVSNVQSSGSHIFTDISGNVYTWVGELRNQHGIRSIHNFATSMSRVGLSESEWLRLSGKSSAD